MDLTEAIIDDQTDWRNSFGDGSVKLPKSIARPCQWRPEGEAPLAVSKFYGYWRAWVEIGGDVTWRSIAPDGFEDVSRIPPPEGCEWQYGPITASDP